MSWKATSSGGEGVTEWQDCEPYIDSDPPFVYNPDKILADIGSHPVHRLYAEVNIGIRDRGERWSKCANCGELYQLDEEWSDHTVCSDRCFKEFAASFSEPL